MPNEDEQNGEEPDDELELPPPMKPISESILVAGDTTSGVSSQRVSGLPVVVTRTISVQPKRERFITERTQTKTRLNGVVS